MQLFDNLVGWWANGQTDTQTRADIDAGNARLDAINKRKTDRDQAYRDYLAFETGEDPGPGKFGPEWKKQVDANRAREDESLQYTISDAAQDGFDAAVKERRDQFTSVAGNVTKGLLGVIPWQVWALGAAVLAFIVIQETGGFARLFKNK